MLPKRIPSNVGDGSLDIVDIPVALVFPRMPPRFRAAAVRSRRSLNFRFEKWTF